MSLEAELRERLRTVKLGSHDAGVLEALLAVATAALRRPSRSPLGARTDSFEPGSLPDRLLLEIARGIQGANADLAERLGTDAWQLSRAGRRLRDLGLAERTRSGRYNSWMLTAAGEREVARRS